MSEQGTAEVHAAVRRGDLQALQELLARGADPDEPDWVGSGDAPILVAGASGSIDVIRALIEAGCDVNARTARGETALHLVVTSRQTPDALGELVTVLLDAGCDAGIQDNLQGRTALHSLVRQLSSSAETLLETFQQLASRTDVNLRDYKLRTSLHRLAGSGCTDLRPFQTLLACGADPSLQNDRGETALHEALERDAPGLADAVVVLVAHTDLTRYTAYRETPLHLAARMNRPTIVGKLLEHGAPVNAQDLRGNTALHLAAGKGYQEVVVLLLAIPGIELNAANKDGSTPLHISVESGFIQVVQLLLKAETCDLTARTKMSLTPFDLAQQEYRRRYQPEMSVVLAQEMEKREGRRLKA